MNSAEGFAIHCYGDGSDERHVSRPYQHCYVGFIA